MGLIICTLLSHLPILQTETKLQVHNGSHAGLPVEKTDNERFSHITRLASTILKTECAAVILGMEDRIVLANSEGLDDEDDFWLPDFCAWALSQASGLVTVENLTQDDR